MARRSTAQELEKYLFRRGGKYPIIATAISLIHIIFLYFFHRIGILPMVIYNILCISGYVFLSTEAYRGNKIKEFFLYSMFEIPIHAVLSTYYVGWNYRFMLILFGAISCIFYFVIFVDDFKHPIVFSAVVSIIYCAIYVGVRIYTSFYTPIKLHIRGSESLESFYIYFNTFITFACLIFFNALFAIEYSFIKKQLLSENSKLDSYATFDPLTGLLNRRSTESQLQALFNKHYYDDDSFSVIMCDIDKFKSVNDTYGHDTGDYVLKEVSSILKDTVRNEDIVGRWGGEEFLILIKANKAKAAALAERIRVKVSEHSYEYKSIELHITITLGVSAYRSNTSVENLVKSADMKLYRGKENGRNQVVS